MSTERIGRSPLVLCAAIGLVLSGSAQAVDLEVVSVDPPAHALLALSGTSITVEFDQPVDPASIDGSSFWGFAKWSGTVQGTYAFSNGNATVTLTPSHKLFLGEQVMIILSHDIQTPGPTLRRR